MEKETTYYIQSGTDDIPIEVSRDAYELYLSSAKHEDMNYVVQTFNTYTKVLIIIE